MDSYTPITQKGPIALLADVHLAKEHTERNRRFCECLTQTISPETAGLYILGDLFDHWLGDDEPGDWVQPIKHAIRSVSRHTPVYILRGNHDSLLGEDFCQQVGAQLVPDPTVVVLDQQRIVLTHGDALCLEDTSFQRLRRILYHPFLQRHFPKLPYRWRAWVGKHMQQQSKQACQTKPSSITDVSPKAVETMMATYKAQAMVHGHTHRPNIHQEVHGVRYVLGDWAKDCPVVWLDGSGVPRQLSADETD